MLGIYLDSIFIDYFNWPVIWIVPLPPLKYLKVAKTAKTKDFARHSNFENGTYYNDCIATKLVPAAMIFSS